MWSTTLSYIQEMSKIKIERAIQKVRVTDNKTYFGAKLELIHKHLNQIFHICLSAAAPQSSLHSPPQSSLQLPLEQQFHSYSSSSQLTIDDHERRYHKKSNTQYYVKPGCLNIQNCLIKERSSPVFSNISIGRGSSDPISSNVSMPPENRKKKLPLNPRSNLLCET